MRAAYEAAFALHDWEPVKVVGGHPHNLGIGVRHPGSELTLWRTSTGQYNRDEMPDRLVAPATWQDIPGGLFWTTVEFVGRKNLWQPEIRKLVASS